MTSGRLSDPSNVEEEVQSDGSVFDFLYYDVTRIASFLSQFDNSGHLTGVTRAERAHRRKQEATKDEISGNLGLVKGASKGETTAELQSERQNTRIYDPRWLNALNFLDYLEERDLLRREITNARIGQIVMLSGSLSMFDLGMLKQMWGLPTVKKVFMSGQGSQTTDAAQVGSRRDRRQSAALQGKKKGEPKEAEIALELMSVLPHAVQAAVSEDGNGVSGWMTLKEDNIAISPSDLFMKHGLTIAGEWTVVGVLDAMPDPDDYFQSDDGISVQTLRQMAAGSKLGFMGSTLAPHFVPPIRELLGRPASSYGITPLLLFREVSGEDR